MTSTLLYIKAKYAGDCTLCGRPIKQGSSILFQSLDRSIYCMTCASKKSREILKNLTKE